MVQLSKAVYTFYAQEVSFNVKNGSKAKPLIVIPSYSIYGSGSVTLGRRVFPDPFL